jgi:hypothetical protein
MPRRRSQRDIAWSRGAQVPGLEPSRWRVDHFGWLMRFEDFEQQNSDFGWTITHSSRLDLDFKTMKGKSALAPIALSNRGRR